MGLSLVVVTVVSLVLRTLHEPPPAAAERPRCTAANRRARAGAVLDDVSCRVNTTMLDAGVCVRLRRSVCCVPSLAIIGAMKSGTTNLMLYLALHPRLRTSRNFVGWPIESRFFSRAVGASDADLWRDYVRKFPQSPGLAFDKSPNYLVNPAVPAVLSRFAPSLKLVLTLRNPSKRAYSHFQHDCRNGRILSFNGTIVAGRGAGRLAYPCSPADFDNLVASQLGAARAKFTGVDWTCRWALGNDGRGDSNALPRGFYACQWARWFPYYPRSQFLVLIFDDFIASRAATLDAVHQIERFVGVASVDYDTLRVRVAERLYAALPSRQSAYAPMRQSTLAKLDDLYCEPNRRLAALLDDRGLPWPCGGRGR